MSSKNNKKSKHNQNSSSTDLPDMKVNTSTTKTSVSRQGTVDKIKENN